MHFLSIQTLLAVTLAMGIMPGMGPAEQPADSEPPPAVHPAADQPPPGPPPNEDAHGSRTPLLELDRVRLRQFVEEHFPEWAGELRRMEIMNKPLYRQRLRELAPRVMRLIHEMEQDEELGALAIEEERLELSIQAAVRRYFETEDPAERKELREEVDRLLHEQFRVRHRRDERRIEKLEARLQLMRHRLDRRRGQAEDIIQLQLEQLLRPTSDEAQQELERRLRRPSRRPADRPRR